MKSIILFISFFLLLVISSCNKTTSEKAIVLRDCTGTYLQINEKDYFVCNFEVLENYSVGSKINAKYKITDKCDVRAACMLYHPYESIILLSKIK